MKISIKNKKGERLSAILTKNKKNKEAVVICHGSRSTKDSGLQEDIARTLKKDYNILRFDFSGNGESEGRLEDSTYTKDIEDIESVLKHLKDKDYQIKVIIGHSKSATDILLIPDIIKRYQVNKLIALSPRIFLKNTTEARAISRNKKLFRRQKSCTIKENNISHHINKDYLMDIKKWWNVKKHFRQITETYIIHGTEDKTISIKEPRNFKRKFKKVRLIEIKKADHGFNAMHNELTKIIKRIIGEPIKK